MRGPRGCLAKDNIEAVKLNIIFYFLLAVVVALLPFFFRNELSYYLSILSLAGIYAIVVMGLNMLMGYAGQISLGHAAFFAAGAYTSAILTTTFSVSPLVSLFPSVIVSGALAFVVGIPTLKLKEHYLAMATLGIGLIMHSLLSANPFDITGGPGGIPGIPPVHVLGFVTDTDRSQYYVIWIITIGMFVLSSNIVNSRFGRALRAIHKSEVVTNVLGVDTYRYKLKIFVLSAVYAGFAGYLYAHCSPLFYVNPDDVCHFVFSIKIVTMVVIGGMNTMWGALFGAVSLTLLPEVLRSLGAYFEGINTSDIEMALYGVILVAVMIFSKSKQLQRFISSLSSKKPTISAS
jgi:branched-chain amino acid transport system permease protein